MLPNKMKVVDLFAGAGGFGLGFELADYNVVCSLEIDQWAADTLRENNPDQLVIQDDIRKYQTLEQVRTVCPISPDIIIGGPPCQGFSVAGPAQKDPQDPRNSLFKDFARWVDFLRPQLFVMENVKGLLSRRNVNREPVINIIKQTFANLGYTVEVWLLNAADYGVPQNRKRVFVVGNRVGLERIGEPPKTYATGQVISDNNQLTLFNAPSLPKALTLWDAISDLPELNAGDGEEEQQYNANPQTTYQKWARGERKTVYNHVAMNHSKRLVERFEHISWGESSADVPQEHLPRQRNGNGKISKKAYDQNNRRLYPYKPSHTIAASFYANFIHPFQHRNITAREGARIQSFPDSYRFMGKKTTPSHKLLQREGRLHDKHLCQYNQIGNAVPPLLAKAIASHIQEVLTNARSRIEHKPEREPSH
ncbi:MAG: DNA cytosine methyltransferase [Chloroflexi bacterium]|nr:DNA cytosine methyltransferase [Chloroflexota bacterium]